MEPPTNPGRFTDVLVAVGATAQYSAVARDAQGQTLTGKAFSWSSSNPAVATVDSDGRVFAEGNGTASIKATVDGIAGSAGISIVQEPASIEVAPVDASLVALDDTLRFVATAHDENGNAVEGVAFEWRSSDDAVATVDDAGLTTAQANGVATITVAVQDLSASAEVSVSQQTAAIRIAPDPLHLTADDIEQLTATAVDANGYEVSGVTITWEVSDDSRGAIDSSGLLSVDPTILPGEEFDVTALGDDIEDTLRVHVVREFTVIAGGFYHSCGLTQDGTAYCWGHNDHGQLGDGTSSDSPTPVAVAGGLSFESLSAGRDHTCGVTSAGAAYCWGYNDRGSLGDGTREDRNLPTPVAGGHTFTAIAAGWEHTCGLVSGGAAYCWGDDYYGVVGDSTTIDVCLSCGKLEVSPIAVAGGHTFTTIAAGRLHTCAVRQDNEGFCWGYNPDGQTGQDNGNNLGLRSYPRPVAGGHAFSRVSTLYDHTCGITTTGAMYCWGRNLVGQVGDGTSGGTSEHPTLVAGDLTFTDLQTGTDHTCGLTNDERIACWGDAAMLGNGQVDHRSTPDFVPGTYQFIGLGGGGHTVFGIDSSGRPYGWGYNIFGEIGTGDANESSPSVIRY